MTELKKRLCELLATIPNIPKHEIRIHIPEQKTVNSKLYYFTDSGFGNTKETCFGYEIAFEKPIDLSGFFFQVIKPTFDFVPLSGTEEHREITGNLKFKIPYYDSFLDFEIGKFSNHLVDDDRVYLRSENMYLSPEGLKSSTAAINFNDLIFSGKYATFEQGLRTPTVGNDYPFHPDEVMNYQCLEYFRMKGIQGVIGSVLEDDFFVIDIPSITCHEFGFILIDTGVSNFTLFKSTHVQLEVSNNTLYLHQSRVKTGDSFKLFYY